MNTLKEATKEKHAIAESLPFIKSIFEGTVDRVQYCDYLYQLHFVYYTLENHGCNLGLFNDIEDLLRASFVRKDFVELASKNYKNICNSETNKYLKYLDDIFYDDIYNRRNRIMAHIYVRHMGDLFGGQQLSKLVPGSASMYKFNNLVHLISEMRKRTSIDMAAEANIAFDFNIAILKQYD